MSGKIIYTPSKPHRCEVLDPLGRYSHAPVGSVYECECGETWVAHEHPARNVLIRQWARESRRARRHRRRIEERRKKRNEEQ
jgi:hypothetical protein